MDQIFIAAMLEPSTVTGMLAKTGQSKIILEKYIQNFPRNLFFLGMISTKDMLMCSLVTG